jgi:hypothetical protein
MKSKCDGKESCSLDIKRTNLDWLTTTPSSGDDCGDNSYMYVQVGCIIPSKYNVERRIFGLLIGCLGVFVYLFTVVYYDYIKAVQ